MGIRAIAILTTISLTAPFGVVVGLISPALAEETKVAQCNQLVQVANQAVTEVETATRNAGSDNIQAMERIVEIADRAAMEMKGLTISDPQLQGFQSRYIAMYDGTSRSTQDIITAAQANDGAAAQDAFQRLQASTNQEEPLVNEVNRYCTAG